MAPLVAGTCSIKFMMDKVSFLNHMIRDIEGYLIYLDLKFMYKLSMESRNFKYFKRKTVNKILEKRKYCKLIYYSFTRIIQTTRYRIR